MIGLQEYIINNDISVIKLAEEMGLQPSAIWRWFNVNKVPDNRLDFLVNKFNIDKRYINKKVNDINTYSPRYKGFNNYKICGDYTIIYLERRKGKPFETIIDTEDLQKLKDLNYCWHVSIYKNTKNSEPFYYAMTTKYYRDDNNKRKSRSECLHKIIMNVQDGRMFDVNHKNHDTLNNRKSNLEVVERDINSQLRDKPNCNNNTGHRNVSYIESSNEYWVQIMKNGVSQKWTFPHDKFNEAVKFAKQKRIELFGKE